MVREPTSEEMRETARQQENAREFACEATEYSEQEDDQLIVASYYIEEVPDEYKEYMELYHEERVVRTVIQLIFQKEFGFHQDHTAASVTVDQKEDGSPLYFCDVAGGGFVERLDGFSGLQIPEITHRQDKE